MVRPASSCCHPCPSWRSEWGKLAPTLQISNLLPMTLEPKWLETPVGFVSLVIVFTRQRQTTT
eukprot:3202561-Amphidinium_carterae.1